MDCKSIYNCIDFWLTSKSAKSQLITPSIIKWVLITCRELGLLNVSTVFTPFVLSWFKVTHQKLTEWVAKATALEQVSIYTIDFW